MPLTDGTEVGITYDGGDIDCSYIADAFHDSEHADIVTRDNRSRNILQTAAGNELRIENKRGEEHAALTCLSGRRRLIRGILPVRRRRRVEQALSCGPMNVPKGMFITAVAFTSGEHMQMAAAGSVGKSACSPGQANSALTPAKVRCRFRRKTA